MSEELNNPVRNGNTLTYTLQPAIIGSDVVVNKVTNDTVVIVARGSDVIGADGNTQISNNVNEVSQIRLACLVAGRWDVLFVSSESW